MRHTKEELRIISQNAYVKGMSIHDKEDRGSIWHQLAMLPLKVLWAVIMLVIGGVIVVFGIFSSLATIGFYRDCNRWYYGTDKLK